MFWVEVIAAYFAVYIKFRSDWLWTVFLWNCNHVSWHV